MMQTPLIHLVDDDEAVRESLALLIGTVGLRVQAWAEPQAFLAGFERGGIGAVVLDVRMPGMGGLAVLERLLAEGVDQPVIMLTGHGTVDMCRRAFKAGAAEFLEKPVNDDQLLEALQNAVRAHVRSRDRHDADRHARERYAQLSPREREVLGLIVAGLTNKEIGRALQLSPRTVETHRANLFAKLEAESLAQLIRHYAQLVDDDAGPSPSVELRRPARVRTHSAERLKFLQCQHGLNVGRNDTGTLMKNTLRLSILSLALALSAAASGFASAQAVRSEKNMSLDLANQIAAASVAACQANGHAVTATVVDRAGSVRAVQRADNAGPHTLAASEQKAFTSASAKNTTLAMMENAQKNPAAANLVHIPGFLLLGGGVPVKVGNEVIGAVGVGGAPGGHLDEQCANTALDKVKELLK